MSITTGTGVVPSYFGGMCRRYQRGTPPDVVSTRCAPGATLAAGAPQPLGGAGFTYAGFATVVVVDAATVELVAADVLSSSPLAHALTSSASATNVAPTARLSPATGRRALRTRACRR